MDDNAEIEGAILDKLVAIEDAIDDATNDTDQDD